MNCIFNHSYYRFKKYNLGKEPLCPWRKSDSRSTSINIRAFLLDRCILNWWTCFRIYWNSTFRMEWRRICRSWWSLPVSNNSGSCGWWIITPRWKRRIWIYSYWCSCFTSSIVIFSRNWIKLRRSTICFWPVNPPYGSFICQITSYKNTNLNIN